MISIVELVNELIRKSTIRYRKPDRRYYYHLATSRNWAPMVFDNLDVIFELFNQFCWLHNCKVVWYERDLYVKVSKKEKMLLELTHGHLRR